MGGLAEEESRLLLACFVVTLAEIAVNEVTVETDGFHASAHCKPLASGFSRSFLFIVGGAVDERLTDRRIHDAGSSAR